MLENDNSQAAIERHAALKDAAAYLLDLPPPTPDEMAKVLISVLRGMRGASRSR